MSTVAIYRLRSWVSDGLCNFLQITGWLTTQVAARNSSELSRQVSQNQWSQVYECLLTRASPKPPGSPLGTNFQLTRQLIWRQMCDKQKEVWDDRCGGGRCREKVQKNVSREHCVQAKKTKTSIFEAISHLKTAPIPTAITLGKKHSH